MKLKNLLLISCIATLIWSCATGELPNGQISLLKVQLNIASDIATRANATTEENIVNTFDIYLFDATSGLLEAMQQNVPASTPSAGNVAGEQKIGDVMFPLTDNKSKNILAIANSSENSVILPKIEIGVTPYADMLEGITALKDETQSPSHPFIMSGYINGVTAHDNNIISLRRRIAKISVINLSSEDGLQINTLQLNQAINQTYLFKSDSPETSENLKYVDYDAITVSGNSAVLYVFPQSAASNKMTLTVVGKLNDADFSQTMPLCPMKENLPQDMEHNAHYTVKLTTTTPGVIQMEMAIQAIEDWSEGEDIPGIITEEQPESPKLISFNGLQWMDRNLGATSADFENDWENAIGAFYQWGRNTAFTSTQSIATISGPVTAEVAEANSEKFITRMNNDWLDGTDNNRWQTLANQPCPEGYRVPTITDFMGIFTSSGVLVNTVTGPFVKSETLADGTFQAHYWGDKSSTVYGIKKLGTAEASLMKWEWLKTNSGKGYVKISRWAGEASDTFSNTNIADIKAKFAALGQAAEIITLPAAGNILGSSGKYSEGSPGGYYWASSFNGAGAHRAEFTSGSMITGGVYNSRISGHSIRCVKE